MNKEQSIVRFYSSQLWKTTREAYRHHVGGLCERCLKHGRYVIGDQVHHKRKLTSRTINDPAVCISFDNLELLCRECHEKEHGKLKQRADKNGHVEL